MVTTARSCSCVRHLRLLHLSTKSIWAKLRREKAAVEKKDGKCSLALRRVNKWAVRMRQERLLGRKSTTVA